MSRQGAAAIRLDPLGSAANKQALFRRRTFATSGPVTPLVILALARLSTAADAIKRLSKFGNQSLNKSENAAR